MGGQPDAGILIDRHRATEGGHFFLSSFIILCTTNKINSIKRYSIGHHLLSVFTGEVPTAARSPMHCRTLIRLFYFIMFSFSRQAFLNIFRVSP